MRHKLIIGALGVLMATAILSGPFAVRAHANSEQPPAYTAQHFGGRHVEWIVHRGIVTSSIYFTERATRWLCDVGPAGLSVIAPIPGTVANIMKAGAGLFVWKACQARADTNCLRVRYVLGAGWPGIVGLYNADSENRWCRRSWRTV